MTVYIVKSYSEAYENEYTHPWIFSTSGKAQEYLDANKGWYTGKDDAIWIESCLLDDWNDRVDDLETNEDWD